MVVFTLWLHRVHVFVILCLVWTQKHGSERVLIQIPYLVCNFNATVVCNVFVQSPASIYLQRNKHVTLLEEREAREAREGRGGKGREGKGRGGRGGEGAFGILQSILTYLLSENCVLGILF